MNTLKSLPEDRRAPKGQHWQCGVCGKRAEERYGIVGRHSYGYDESCAMNAVLVDGEYPQ